MKVVFVTPTRDKPHPAYLAAMEASVPALDAAGIKHSITWEIGCPYISSAMASLTRKALDTMPDAIVYLDDDMSWTPEALVKLITCPEHVVGGTYRFKKDVEEYMGVMMTTPDGVPIQRPNGLIVPKWMPSGFLKITARAIDTFMKAFPELNCGPSYHPTPDLFNHGAHNGIWYGQDYAFCRNYAEKCGSLALIPDLDITHNGFDGKVYPGNFHRYLLKRPGGSESDAPRTNVAARSIGAQLRQQLEIA